MRQKRLQHPFRPRPPVDDGTPLDLGASARQVGLIESATGWMHPVSGIIVALATALTLTGLRAWWRANTAPRSKRR